MNRSMHSLSLPIHQSFSSTLSFLCTFWVVSGWYAVRNVRSCLSRWKNISFATQQRSRRPSAFSQSCFLSVHPFLHHHQLCVLPSFSCFLPPDCLSILVCCCLIGMHGGSQQDTYQSRKKMCSISVVYGRDAIKVMVIEAEREIIIFCVYNMRVHKHSLVRVFLIKCNEIWYTVHRSLSSA